MDIQAFADRHRLKTSLDSCGTRVIEGRAGQIYEFSADRLGVMFAPPSETDKCGHWCPRIWNKFREAGKVLGMAVQQNGDSEGCLLFDVNDRLQAKLACQIAKVRPKRRLTEEQAAQGAARLANYRLNRSAALQEGPSSVCIEEKSLG